MSLSDEDSVGQLVTEPREHVSASLHIGYQLLMHMYWKLETFKLHDCEFYARICVHVRTYVHMYMYVQLPVKFTKARTLYIYMYPYMNTVNCEPFSELIIFITYFYNIR